MSKFEVITGSAHHAERKHRRFSLAYPVRVKFVGASGTCECQTVSRNISLGGMLLETQTLIPQRTEVSFILTLQGGHIVRPMDVAGNGEVVRVEKIADGTGYAVALQCSRPLVDVTELA